MIADACHSGTLNRSIDPRAFHFTPRLAFRGDQAAFELTTRPGPRFPGVLGGQDAPQGGSLERADLSNVVYIGAAQDDQLVLEASLPVEGAPSRGLLTYSFEQGLTSVGADGKTLAADLNGDGKKQSSEEALKNWRVFIDYDLDGVWDQNEEPSDLTDATGYWSLQSVDEGRWRFRVFVQQGWDAPTGAARAITLGSAQIFQKVNFGVRQIT